MYACTYHFISLPCLHIMLNRFTYILLLGLLLTVAFLFIHFSSGKDVVEPRYMGAQRCRVCHEAASLGASYKVWSASPHARAYQTLFSDSARAYLAANNSSIESCLGCHTTLGHPPLNEAEQVLHEEGVSCERCHGAGSNYVDYNTMMDHDAFINRGGVAGTLRDCYQCHAENPATADKHCPFQREQFVADSAWAMIRHQVPRTGRRVDTSLTTTR